MSKKRQYLIDSADWQNSALWYLVQLADTENSKTVNPTSPPPPPPKP